MRNAIMIVLALLSQNSIAQQDIMISQYMFNGLFLNPAYSGSHRHTEATLLHRRQWLNFPGAPVTNIFGIDAPIAKQKMGLGFLFASESIGATDQVDLFGNYSYHLKVGKGKLSLGLRAGGSLVSANLSQLKTNQLGDEAFSNIQTRFLPKFGTGIYYYTKKYYAGLSIPTLIAYESGRSFGVDLNASTTMRRHFFLTGGYVFEISDAVKLKPSTLIKYEPSAPLQADINLNVLLNNVFWIGVSYRTGEAAVSIIEYQINQMFRIGYAYDYNLTEIRKFSSGSHEIMFGINFGKEVLKTKNPRYF